MRHEKRLGLSDRTSVELGAGALGIRRLVALVRDLRMEGGRMVTTAKIIVTKPMPGLYHVKVYRNGNRIEGVFHVSAEEQPTGGYVVSVGFLDRMLDYEFHADEVEIVREWEARDEAMVVVEPPK